MGAKAQSVETSLTLSPCGSLLPGTGKIIRKTATYNLRYQLQFYTSINVHPSKPILTLQLWNRDKHRQLGSKDNHTSLRNSIRNFNRRKFSSGNSLRRMYHTTLIFSAESGIAKDTQKDKTIKIILRRRTWHWTLFFMLLQCKVSDELVVFGNFALAHSFNEDF